MNAPGADLTGQDFTDAELTDADLSGADLMGVDFRGATLVDADLSETDLTGGDLRGADLTDADLSGATLTGTDLRDADLTDVSLTDATLTGADEEALESGHESGDASLVSLVESVVTGAILVLAFALLAIGWSGFWLVFVIGFAAVYPAATRLARWYENETRAAGSVSDGSGRSNSNSSSNPDSSRGERATTLETVRERYAAGELTDAEFERRVEQLLEPEPVSDAEGASRASETDPADPTHETETERERETERR